MGFTVHFLLKMADTTVAANVADGSFRDCRMYEQELPDKDDLVVVRVNKVEEFGAYVTLLEYNNIEAMILSSEVSRKRIRSIHKHLRIGKQDVMQVLRVDKEKGYIDLSKKYVTENDINAATIRYQKSKTVHSIMKNTARNCGIPLIELLQKVAWPLYDKHGEEEEEEEGEEKHALDGLQAILLDESLLDEYELEPAVKECLIKDIKHRLAEQPLKIQAQIEVTCFKTEGILSIKEALMKGKQYAEENNLKLEIQLMSTPVYRLLTQCTDKTQGTEVITKAMQEIEETIKSTGGNFTIKEPPQEV